jgi:hypothetical protein
MADAYRQLVRAPNDAMSIPTNATRVESDRKRSASQFLQNGALLIV